MKRFAILYPDSVASGVIKQKYLTANSVIDAANNIPKEIKGTFVVVETKSDYINPKIARELYKNNDKFYPKFR
jgi:hypothetical protein